MGLLYQFPISTEETEYVELSEGSIILKSYGLPLIFWGYAIAIIVALIGMGIGIYGPVSKILSSNDLIDLLIGYSISSLLIFMPIILIGFFFYEKSIIRSKE